MEKVILSFNVILFFLAYRPKMIHAQAHYEVVIDTINQIESNGLMQGEWIEYNGFGVLHNRVHYKNNLKEGAYYYYDWYGKLSELGFYEKVVENGYVFSFKKNKLWRSFLELDSCKYRIERYYYEKNQLPKSGGNWCGGNAQSVFYSEDGGVSSVSSTKNLLQDGFYTDFYINVQLKNDLYYSEGRP